MRILVIEDDKKVAGFLKKGMNEKGYSVDVCYDGEEGCEYAEIEDYDLIILDVMLPQKDGFQVCIELRQKSVLTPIIMLTARDAIEDKVIGLQEGADDYVTKPSGGQNPFYKKGSGLPKIFHWDGLDTLFFFVSLCVPLWLKIGGGFW